MSNPLNDYAWKQSDNLLYRISGSARNASNLDEVRVTRFAGSTDPKDCTSFAKEILAFLRSTSHELFVTADADKPSYICDQNGEVVLAQCKKCYKAEADLDVRSKCLGSPGGQSNSPRVDKAVLALVEMFLYYDDDRLESWLKEVIRLLDPEIADLMNTCDYKAAYRKAKEKVSNHPT